MMSEQNQILTEEDALAILKRAIQDEHSSASIRQRMEMTAAELGISSEALGRAEAEVLSGKQAINASLGSTEWLLFQQLRTALRFLHAGLWVAVLGFGIYVVFNHERSGVGMKDAAFFFAAMFAWALFWSAVRWRASGSENEHSHKTFLLWKAWKDKHRSVSRFS